jgi:hypothetical protein
VCGGIFASLLNQFAWWPWMSFILAIWVAVLAVASVFTIPQLPPHPPFPKGLKAWIDTLDVPGAIVGVVALVLFNFAWTQAPIDGWDKPSVIVPLVLGLVLFGCFLYIEFYHSPKPLLPFDAVNADVAFVLSAMVAGWGTFGIWTLYLVQILEDIRGLSPLLAATWFCPVAIAGVGAAVLTGKMLGSWGVTPPTVMMISMLAFTTGAVLTVTAPTDQIYWGQIFVSVLVMPFGMDMSFPAATLTLSNSVAKEHQGIGASLVNTIVNYGIALGVGFAGTVEVHVHGNGDTPSARLQGYRGGLWMGVGLGGLGLIIAGVCLWREKIHSKKAPVTERTAQA